MFCFLSLVVENLGGVRAAISHQEEEGEPLICNSANKDYKLFYIKMHSRLSMVMSLRPIVVLFQAVFMMLGQRHPDVRAYKAISSLLALVSAAILLTAFISLAIFYFSVMKHCSNIYGTVKIFLLKICVGAIVIQGLVELVLSEYGSDADQADDWTGQSYKYLRVYCLLVLAEYSLLTPIMYYGYGSKITLQLTNGAIGAGGGGGQVKAVAPFDDAVYRPSMTFYDFLREILYFSDTFKNLSYDKEALLSTPLSQGGVNRVE